MTKYRFKPKTYGYGFYPISREGRLATLVFILIMLLSAYTNGLWDVKSMPEEEIKIGLRFFLDIIIFSGLFTIICKDKVKGGLQWKRGRDKKH